VVHFLELVKNMISFQDMGTCLMLGTDCPVFEAVSLSYATQPIVSDEHTVIYDGVHKLFVALGHSLKSAVCKKRILILYSVYIQFLTSRSNYFLWWLCSFSYYIVSVFNDDFSYPKV